MAFEISFLFLVRFLYDADTHCWNVETKLNEGEDHVSLSGMRPSGAALAWTMP